MAKPPAKKPTASKKRADKRGTPKAKGTIKPKHGGRIGNPPHVPTPELRKLAETHAAVGTPQWAIAEEMDISEDTLQRHYAKELRLGLVRMNARVGSMIANKALAGDGDMQKFWASRRDPAFKSKNELSTPPGQPLEFRNLTDEEIKARIAEHEARRRAGE
jgi:hypothetical protein